MYILKRGPDGGPPGLDTHAQIAIGVIIPVVVLLGGLLLFIWYTERQRRSRRGDSIPRSSHAPSRPKINSYLHRGSKALPGIRTSQIDVDAIEIVRPRASDAKMHELEDTGKVELQEMQKTLNRLNNRLHRSDDDRERTSSPRNVSDRNDSAIEAAAARLESRDTDRSREGPERKELDTTKMEHVLPQTPHESKRYSNREYRSSLQPEYRSSLKPGMSKRDTRVASSRYSKEVRYSKDVEARFSKDAAARYSANVEQLRDLHHNSTRISTGAGFSHTSLHARDNRDSNVLSPSKESLEQGGQHFTYRLSTQQSNPNLLPTLTSDSPDSPTVSDISRPTNRNSALSAVPNDHRASQRWSGVPTSGENLPSWMKRLSVQDTVEGKWRSEGEIVPPENVRANGNGGDGGVGVNGVQGT
ncbi:hypothetical protein PRZ48_004524 [Zasmidium cellare]|uniref:Uncharacterized protein n=1 Tax=Zasmidium cellare TaxID=395010 RepID=A0ABR0EQF1_ZASCE|nr:hypothetical protein PRZ48_004524 [Zasmidium cellare]